jgi:uncharacterized protein (TIGR02001 family)
MKIKQFTVVLIALMVLATSAIQSTAATIDVEGAAYAGLSSMYLWRGFDLSNGDPVVQGGMDVSVEGLTFSYWSNLDLDSGELNETDFTIDYGMALSELVAIGFGNVFYALDGAPDTNELYLGISLNTLLAPTLTLYYDYDEAEEDGLFYTLAIGQDLKLTEGLRLSLGGLVSYNQKSDYAVGNYSDWHNYELSLAADYAPTEQLSISPFVIFSDAISDEAEALIKDELVGGLNLTLTF